MAEESPAVSRSNSALVHMRSRESRSTWLPASTKPLAKRSPWGFSCSFVAEMGQNPPNTKSEVAFWRWQKGTYPGLFERLLWMFNGEQGFATYPHTEIESEDEDKTNRIGRVH